MGKIVGIGNQDFEVIRKGGYFYVDKTSFIRQWWEGGDQVTLITRPRRFGKTLNMSMVEKFFSLGYAGREDLFLGLKIWEDEGFRKLQGSYPVLLISFADVKESCFLQTRKKICTIIRELYSQHRYLLKGDMLSQQEKQDFQNISADMENYQASGSIKALSNYLFRYYGKRVIILLDEYDTPMQEAYVNGYWNELVSFTRSLFNATFKTNPNLERGILTGITRVSKESVFSDLNNLEVITTTSRKYADCFGFTEEEVAALCAQQTTLSMEEISEWYNGYQTRDDRRIYNPRSVVCALEDGACQSYWTNTGKMDEVLFYLKHNIDEVREDAIKMVNHMPVRIEIRKEYTAGQGRPTTKKEIYAAMIIYGLLSYCDGELRIPNKELMLEFESALEDHDFGYVTK